MIQRFSEDIDFKVVIEGKSAKEVADKRRAYREEVTAKLQAADFVLDGKPLIGNSSQFFRVSFHYGPQFQQTHGMRPGLQIEMTFSGTERAAVPRVVQSLLSRTLRGEPEVSAMLCVSPLETAADKISALAWRTAARDRKSKDDDPAIVRHLHDLAALAPTVGATADFVALARQLLEADAKRSRDASRDGPTLLRDMLPTIKGDPLWKAEYEQYVSAVSFGPDADRISYDAAIAACEEMVAAILA